MHAPGGAFKVSAIGSYGTGTEQQHGLLPLWRDKNLCAIRLDSVTHHSNTCKPKITRVGNVTTEDRSECVLEGSLLADVMKESGLRRTDGELDKGTFFDASGLGIGQGLIDAARPAAHYTSRQEAIYFNKEDIGGILDTVNDLLAAARTPPQPGHLLNAGR